MRLNIVTALLIGVFFVNVGVCQESAPALKNDTFVMAFAVPENNYFDKWWRMIYAEVFKRLGIKASFRAYPPKRASMEADAGNVDGESGRIFSYADDHPNLIRVEEFLFIVNFSAFAVKNFIPELKGWESLKGTDYRVEYRIGVRMCEMNLPKVVRKENLSDIIETSRALKKLVSDRTDLFVDDEAAVLALLNTPEFKDSKIRLAGVMESVPTYPYLHKKHAALAPKMAEIIKAMKAEGLIEKYRVIADTEFGIVRK